MYPAVLFFSIWEINFEFEGSYIDVFSISNSFAFSFEREYLVTVILGSGDKEEAWVEVDGPSPNSRIVFLKTWWGVPIPFSEVTTMFSFSVVKIISLSKPSLLFVDTSKDTPSEINFFWCFDPKILSKFELCVF